MKSKLRGLGLRGLAVGRSLGLGEARRRRGALHRQHAARGARGARLPFALHDIMIEIH